MPITTPRDTGATTTSGLRTLEHELKGVPRIWGQVQLVRKNYVQSKHKNCGWSEDHLDDRLLGVVYRGCNEVIGWSMTVSGGYGDGTRYMTHINAGGPVRSGYAGTRSESALEAYVEILEFFKGGKYT